MKSQFADVFNHDEDAPSYDTDVLNESHPVRAGYDAVLNWVVEKSGTTPDSVVLDLGAGTGNLSRRLKQYYRLVCVDISANMLALAREKLAHLHNLEFVTTDLLAYFDGAPTFDVIVSTYAVHHLTEDEKRILFEKIYQSLRPDGRAVFGDLMFADEPAKQHLIHKFQSEGHLDVVADFDDEFFWSVDKAINAMTKLGFTTETKQFSDLSWGIAARKL